MNKKANAEMDWPGLLAYLTGRVDQELLLRNEYLAAENRILRANTKGRLQLSDEEQSTLAEIGLRLGHKALPKSPWSPGPDTIRAGSASWWRASLMVRDCDRRSGERGSTQPSKI